MSLLAIDIGNSNIVYGLFEGQRLAGHWRIRTSAERTADEYGLQLTGFLDRVSFTAAPPTSTNTVTPGEAVDSSSISGGAYSPVDGVVIASVVPDLEETFRKVSTEYLGFLPLEVGPETPIGIPIRYQTEASLGADRKINALAAVRLVGAPSIVIDFGTAIKLEAVSREGEYLGGAIAPGVGIAMEALFRRGARLPRITLAPPLSPIGSSTLESLRSGCFYGFVGLAEGLLHRFEGVLGPSATVIATGGWAEAFAGHVAGIHRIEPHLTLIGLRLLWEELSPGRSNLEPAPS